MNKLNKILTDKEVVAKIRPWNYLSWLNYLNVNLG